MVQCKALWIVLLAFVVSCYAEEKPVKSPPKCQFGKSSRKQIPVTPLKEKCLRDIVVQLADSFQNLTNEELGVPKFQAMLDKLEFVDTITTLNTRLGDLTKNLNDKLRRYTDLLKDSNSVIQPILLKQEHDIYSSNQRSDSRSLETCAKINEALAMNIRNQDWKNLHILPVSNVCTHNRLIFYTVINYFDSISR